jgi:hypothetical protein
MHSRGPDGGQMRPRIGLEERFLALVLETWIRRETKERSLTRKPTFGETTMDIEQMTSAGSGVEIKLYIPRSHHTFYHNNDRLLSHGT